MAASLREAHAHAGLEQGLELVDAVRGGAEGADDLGERGERLCRLRDTWELVRLSDPEQRVANLRVNSGLRLSRRSGRARTSGTLTGRVCSRALTSALTHVRVSTTSTSVDGAVSDGNHYNKMPTNDSMHAGLPTCGRAREQRRDASRCRHSSAHARPTDSSSKQTSRT
jgi:hypothetical protein